ncbi:MAG: ATP-binding protein [Deltaproteobacteria bacterium]|nr:ATP-binding protein [Myxococcales bacterium]MDP3221190.1 ATP-binding protein [Deltaproteobacteria bacterium]
MSARSIAERLTAPLPAPRADDLRPWLRAAAVLDTFDLASLRPFGAPGVEAPASLRTRAEPVVGGQLRLRDSVRATALAELASEGLLAAARAANPGRDSSRQRSLDAWLSGAGVAWTKLPASELRAALQVRSWLGPLPLPGLPDTVELEGRLRHIERLEPLSLSSLGFRDRVRQLKALRAHVESAARPLMVYGAGGSGKSALMARFLLELEAEPGRAWAYLDLDDEAIDARRPNTLLRELVRQLGEQDIALASLARVAASELASGEEAGESDRGQRMPESVRTIVQGAAASGRLVIVVDTFEEAQVEGEAVGAALVALAVQLLAVAPGVRVIFSGRVPVDGMKALKVGDLPMEHALAVVRGRVSTSVPVAPLRALMSRVGTQPLTLRLLGDVLERAHREGEGLRSLSTKLEALGDAVKREQIQGFLYLRVLKHLRPDAALQRLAHASLALPAFDRRLLDEVVGPACRMEPERVEAAVAALQAEVAFVEPLPRHPGWLRHRADLRMRVEPFLSESLAQVDLDIDSLRRDARTSLAARRPPVADAILAGFGGPAGLRPRVVGDDVIGRARALLAEGELDAVERLLATVPTPSESAAMLLARARFARGDLAGARSFAANAIIAPMDASPESAADFLAWVADRLDGYDVAIQGFHRRVLAAPLPALRALAAAGAAAARVGARSPVPQVLLETWRLKAQGAHATDPALVGRLAGLMATREAVLEALELARLPGLTLDDQRRIAEGLMAWDRERAGNFGLSIARALNVVQSAARAGLPDAPLGVEAWTQALQAQGGADPSDILLKLTYEGEVSPSFLLAVAGVYLARDTRRLRGEETTQSAAPDEGYPARLDEAQFREVSKVLASAFRADELQRIGEAAMGAEVSASIDWRGRGSGVVYALLQEATRAGRLPDLLEAAAAGRPQRGLDELFRRAIARR